MIAAALPERVGHTFKFQKDVWVQLIIQRGLYLSKHLSGFRRVSFRLYSKIKFRVFRAHCAAITVPLRFPASEVPPLTPSSIQPSPTSYQPSSTTVPVNRGETVPLCNMYAWKSYLANILEVHILSESGDVTELSGTFWGL